MPEARSILFVCTGNTCRSVMACGIAKMLNPEWQIDCAGTMAADGGQPSRHTLSVLDEIGVDMSAYRSKPVAKLTPGAYDQVFVMEPFHQVMLENGWDTSASTVVKLLHPGKEAIPDPVGGTLDAYRECRDALQRYVSYIE